MKCQRCDIDDATVIAYDGSLPVPSTIMEHVTKNACIAALRERCAAMKEELAAFDAGNRTLAERCAAMGAEIRRLDTVIVAWGKGIVESRTLVREAATMLREVVEGKTSYLHRDLEAMADRLEKQS